MKTSMDDGIKQFSIVDCKSVVLLSILLNELVV